MAMEKSWVEQQESKRLFQGADVLKQAGKMLQRTRTNRILVVKQAKLIVVAEVTVPILREIYGGDWSFMTDLSSQVQDAQLTIGQPENSRVSFAKVLTVEAVEQKQQEKKQGMGL